MNVLLWIVAGVLAAVFLLAGVMKATQPRARLAPQLGWVEDFSDAGVKLIGTAEILGAIGLILPGALGIAAVLTPTAALLLALTMVGAVIVHIRRDEVAQSAPAIVLGLLSLFVAIERFGPHSF